MSWSASSQDLKNASRLSNVARMVGSYAKLVLLSQELQAMKRLGLQGIIVRDDVGDFKVVIKPE